MEFPLNQLKIDPAYISAVEDEMSVKLISQFASFKRYSAALVMAFKIEKEKYGSIGKIPHDILQVYSSSLRVYISLHNNLRRDLQRQVNKNTKDLEYIQFEDGEGSCINEITARVKERLIQKIKYYDHIEILYEAINFCMEFEGDLKPIQ